MPASDDPLPPQLKDWFDEKRYRFIARELGTLSAKFDEKRFLKHALSGLAERSLMQRLHECAVAVDAALPGSFQQKVRLLQKLAPRLDHSFIAIFLSDFVATYGVAEFDFSMESLRFFTRFGSAEFAVRGFILSNQSRAFEFLLRWTQDADEHVRRLASEGLRPRLPWGMRLGALVRDPTPCAAIIEALKDDPSLYVRRSVANHLNDITKDHPDWVLSRLEAWDLEKETLAWISRHACRTLIKCGHPRALQLFGFGRKADVTTVLTLSSTHIQLGERLAIVAEIKSESSKSQRLAVDYVIHYMKARGAVFEKVFKWTEVELASNQTLQLTKSQLIRDFTTRKHHPGHHRIELQINGQRVAAAGFELKVL
jgi:3-methyladenine DNA glycosylase AlkC